MLAATSLVPDRPRRVFCLLLQRWCRLVSSWRNKIFSIICHKVVTLFSIFDLDFKTHHITVETIRMMTSNTALKKSMTTWPFSPSVPRNVPKTRQKNTMPKVFVPLLYCITLINSSFSKTSVDTWSVIFWTGCFFGTYTVCACNNTLLLLNYKLIFSFSIRYKKIEASSSPVEKLLETNCLETCSCKIINLQNCAHILKYY